MSVQLSMFSPKTSPGSPSATSSPESDLQAEFFGRVVHPVNQGVTCRA